MKKTKLPPEPAWRALTPTNMYAEDGITRADGTPPYNSYLWPTEQWWLHREHRQFSSRWELGYVALSDGRFCDEGSTYAIHHDEAWGGQRKNNFSTRTTAIRAVAARLIIVMRGSRTWQANTQDKLTGERLAFAINWVLQTVARECAAPPPRIVTIKPIVKPPELTGMPLFDHPHKPELKYERDRAGS